MNARMIVDVGYAIDVAKGATYPKNYDDNQCIQHCVSCFGGMKKQQETNMI
ncbi:MAG: hypothetical protein LC127_05965 [Chitinophagales bacterium]|nr:hypothetical protein [Chitinophagales bacterium]